MTVLYITYIDFSDCDSGNYLRPARMYEAFLREGHSVYLLSGEQERNAWKERKRKVAETEKWLDSHTPDICYIESPVYPILLTCDYRLIRRIHAMGIPMGYFYRDFYFKFPDLYPKRTGVSNRMKDAWLMFLQRRTDRLLKRVDIVYFPSRGCTELFPYADMRPLPPAAEIHPIGKGEGRSCIYVGGLGGHYGGKTLLEAFRILNAGEESFPLLLVCRESEWKQYADEWGKEPWLEVHHASGDALLPLYARAALAVLPIEKNRYTDFAVNVKLFEYMSYGLPIAATSVREIGSLIRENGLGRADAENADTLAREICDMLADESAMAQWRQNCETVLREKHLWIHRVRQIVRELGEKR